LARWLAIAPKVLILDEPTQGIDVGAKAEIYRLVERLAKEGVAILMVSSDLPEILGLADRVAVMRGGRLVTVLARAEATQERILEFALEQEAAAEELAHA
ncbi:MAG: sugar ABC transporter ATP-binding protein, partial [Victivallales bacterium]|nr:sugar ABC transporter ATP-binding protein [Victivallales bacterium]